MNEQVRAQMYGIVNFMTMIMVTGMVAFMTKRVFSSNPGNQKEKLTKRSSLNDIIERIEQLDKQLETVTTFEEEDRIRNERDRLARLLPRPYYSGNVSYALSAEGLVPLITRQLIRMGEDYHVKPPIVEFTEHRGMLSLLSNILYVGRSVVDMWKLDRGQTEKFLRFGLAHEFHHYLLTARAIPIPVPRHRKEERRLWAEMTADEFAKATTGFTRSEINKILQKLKKELVSSDQI